MTNRALIIVDVQKDFCEGGSLAVEGGAEVARRITDYVRRCQDHGMSAHIQRYKRIVATRDWHINPGIHFASNTPAGPDFVNTWPDHCVAGTNGSEFHPNLEVAPDCFIYKGMTSAAYSGFEGAYAQDLYIDRRLGTLEDFLRQQKIDAVDVVGIAFDFCVLQTAVDASLLGFDTCVRADLTASVNPDNDFATINTLNDNGVKVIRYA